MSKHNQPLQTIATSTDVLQLVQLTDTHLCEAAGGTLLGMDTDHSLSAVIDLVLQEREDIDVVLGTGDLSDRGALESYGRLQTHFGRVGCESYWLPGNHDDRAQMEHAAASPSRLSKEIRSKHWQVLLLDSQIPGEVGGRLGATELELLEQGLREAQDAELHTLVCLHHQPVRIGSTWLDEQMVADADDFFSVLDQYSSVRSVLWGHIHQEYDQQRNGVRLLASPSTCVQFAPGSDGFKADELPPGYRWLDLHPDGRIETGVSRVWDKSFTVEMDAGGYL